MTQGKRRPGLSDAQAEIVATELLVFRERLIELKLNLHRSLGLNAPMAQSISRAIDHIDQARRRGEALWDARHSCEAPYGDPEIRRIAADLEGVFQSSLQTALRFRWWTKYPDDMEFVDGDPSASPGRERAQPDGRAAR